MVKPSPDLPSGTSPDGPTGQLQFLNEEDRLKETIDRAMALLGQMTSCSQEMALLLASLREKPKRSVRELDANGEPTWNFQVKVRIPKDITLTKAFREYAAKQGFKEKELPDLWEGFVNWYTKQGTKWMHWSKVWFDWCRRECKRRSLNGGPQVPSRSSRSLPEFGR